MQRVEYKTIEELRKLVAQDQKRNKAFFQKLKKEKPKNLDEQFYVLHNEAFKKFSCLYCANCCSTISPIVTDKDIERLAKQFRKRPADIIGEYLYLDDDGDYVFKSTPCPFLLPDNYCMVYENRPKACREYPHTDRRKMVQILNLTHKNCEVCPVVYKIIEELKMKF